MALKAKNKEEMLELAQSQVNHVASLGSRWRSPNFALLPFPSYHLRGLWS